MKAAGMILVILGIVMMMVTGFNLVTKEKVVDVGPVEVSKSENHPVQWSPLVGAVMLIGGLVMLAAGRSAK